jgi:hypothetical protein
MPKYVAERQVPVKLRTLQEILNPQPQARQVYADVLDWIDEVDLASQTGAARPPFMTKQGTSIFPADVLWWLTMQQQLRKTPEGEEDIPDEDGPPSEEEQENDGAANYVEEDSDPLSSDDDMNDMDRGGLGRAPEIAWKNKAKPYPRGHPSSNMSASLPQDAPVPVYNGYFEQQEAARCGMHALNNALGRAFANAGDMVAACDELLRSMQQDRDGGGV